MPIDDIDSNSFDPADYREQRNKLKEYKELYTALEEVDVEGAPDFIISKKDKQKYSDAHSSREDLRNFIKSSRDDYYSLKEVVRTLSAQLNRLSGGLCDFSLSGNGALGLEDLKNGFEMLMTKGIPAVEVETYSGKLLRRPRMYVDDYIDEGAHFEDLDKLLDTQFEDSRKKKSSVHEYLGHDHGYYDKDTMRIFVYNVWKGYFKILTNTEFGAEGLKKKVFLPERARAAYDELLTKISEMMAAWDAYSTAEKRQGRQLKKADKDIAAIEKKLDNYVDELKSKIKALEKDLKIQRQQYTASKGTGDFLLKVVGAHDSSMADTYSMLPDSDRAFFLGWLCKHITKIELKALPGGRSQAQLDALGITGYDISAKKGDNAGDAIAGILVFDTNNIPDIVQGALNKLTQNKLFIGNTRQVTGEVVNRRLNSTELALYLVLKFDWPVEQPFSLSEEEAFEIQRREAPDEENAFDKGFGSVAESYSLREDLRDEVLDFIKKRWANTDGNGFNGNCYWFAKILCERFRRLEMYYLPIAGHFVAGDGTHFYDASGEVTPDEEPGSFKRIRQEDPLGYRHLLRDCGR